MPFLISSKIIIVKRKKLFLFAYNLGFWYSENIFRYYTFRITTNQNFRSKKNYGGHYSIL